MKIGILTAIWQRPKVTDIFAAGIKRLQTEFDIIPVVVGSEGLISQRIAERHNFVYLEHRNKPLSKKFNAGLRAFRQYDVDYIMIMGSDDLISNNLIDAYMPYMEKREKIIGILDLYFFDLYKKNLFYWPGYGFRKDNFHRRKEPIGLARCFSIDVIEQFKYKLWPDNIDRSLDWHSWNKVKRNKIKPVTINIRDINALAVDLKSDTNICRLSSYDLEKTGHSIFSLLSKEEREMINRFK